VDDKINNNNNNNNNSDRDVLLAPFPSPPPSPTVPPCCLFLFAPPSIRGLRLPRWISKKLCFRFRFRSSTTTSLSAVWSGLRRRLRLSAAARLPPVLIPLLVSHFFSWSAMMALHIFYTDFVGRAIMDGDPNAGPESDELARYNLGIRIGSQGLFLNALVSMTFSLLLDRLLSRISARAAWTSTLYIFILATAAMMLTKSVALHFLLIGVTGLLYAVINALPIALINEYHENQQVFFGLHTSGDGGAESSSSLSSSSSSSANHHHRSQRTLEEAPPPPPPSERAERRGIGTDMALLDSAYFLSQVFITSSLGYLSHWTDGVYVYIIFANVSALLSVLTLADVVFNPADLAAISAGTTTTKTTTT